MAPSIHRRCLVLGRRGFVIYSRQVRYLDGVYLPARFEVSESVNSERTILLTELETWALEDMIRHTWVDDGRPVGKGLLLKIFTLLDEFESRRGQPDPPHDLAVALTEDECWAIDFHIRRGHVDPSGVRIGRELLLKVFQVILELRNSEEVRLLGLRDAPSDHSNRDTRPRLQDLRDFLEQDGKRDEESGASDDGSAEQRP